MLPLLWCLVHHRSMIHEGLIISQAPLNIFLARMLYALSVHLVSSTGTLDLVWPLQYHSTVKPCARPNITQGISLPTLRTLCSKVSLIAVVSSIYKMYVLIHFAKLHVWTLSEHVNISRCKLVYNTDVTSVQSMFDVHPWAYFKMLLVIFTEDGSPVSNIYWFNWYTMEEHIPFSWLQVS